MNFGKKPSLRSLELLSAQENDPHRGNEEKDADDLEWEVRNSEKLEIAQYFLSLPHGFIQLLKNKALNSAQQLAYLVPELKNLDYFLLVQDETEQLDLSNFMEKLSRNPLVQSIVRIDISKLKSKENLLTY